MQNPKKPKYIQIITATTITTGTKNAQISKQNINALAINNIFMAKMAEKKDIQAIAATTSQMSFTLGR